MGYVICERQSSPPMCSMLQESGPSARCPAGLYILFSLGSARSGPSRQQCCCWMLQNRRGLTRIAITLEESAGASCRSLHESPSLYSNTSIGQEQVIASKIRRPLNGFRAWSQGEVQQEPVPKRVLQSEQISHQCNKCLGPHMAVKCAKGRNS